MIPRSIKILILVSLLLGSSSFVLADPFPNHTPSLIGDDIDGPGSFYHGPQALSFEMKDFFESNGFSGAVFGFYFVEDPSTLIPIFDDTDSLGNSAEVYFDLGGGLGAVRDVEDNVVQSVFNVGGDKIGFYMAQADTPVPLFTQALLNENETDLTAAYPFLGGAPFSYLISFYLPFEGGVLRLAEYAVSPIAPVPLPGAAGLWLLGIAGLALFRRRLAAYS